MAITLRLRRARYDNIAVGSATGPERTMAGETVSPVEIYGGGQQTSTSTGDVNHTNIAVGTSVSNAVIENVVAGTAGYTGENVDSTSNITT